ncbi:MAG: hypothetical protein M5U08_07250 [Burkholderiales bacterium]|nr:hypothetical protein [Burkholderiales bacterium]
MLIRSARGLTIIELLTGLVLLGILMVLAMPTFVQMLHNQKLRAGAESISAGLQIARTEALRRNAQVEFLLTDTEPVEDNVGGPNVNTAGPHWMVRAKQYPRLPVRRGALRVRGQRPGQRDRRRDRGRGAFRANRDDRGDGHVQSDRACRADRERRVRRLESDRRRLQDPGRQRADALPARGGHAGRAGADVRPRRHRRERHPRLLRSRR